MKTLSAAAAVALTLAGCASAPRPQLSIIHHPAPVIKAEPAPAPVVESQKPATFKQRWQEFKKKHPVKWFHTK